jgi:hypothetical protein
MRQTRFLALVAAFASTVALALTLVWGAGYESPEKLGLPTDVDPNH